MQAGIVIIGVLAPSDSVDSAANDHGSHVAARIRHGTLGRVWSADRGVASAANPAGLRQSGRRSMTGAAKAEVRRFASPLATGGWRTVQEGIEVTFARRPDTGETVILCRSVDRRAKERAIHGQFGRRIEAALARLAARISGADKCPDAAAVQRQIGGILQQSQRAAARC
jgi:hypothetical protein